MRALPEWFGIEEAILEYRKSIERMETFVAERAGTLAGFLTLNQHNQYSAEIHVMAVRPEYHRMGIGTSLIRHAERLLHARSTEYLQVKTLGPSRQSEAYARTREFYQIVGFRPLEENNLWGDANPCLIMVKHLSCRS